MQEKEQVCRGYACFFSSSHNDSAVCGYMFGWLFFFEVPRKEYVTDPSPLPPHPPPYTHPCILIYYVLLMMLVGSDLCLGPGVMWHWLFGLK